MRIRDLIKKIIHVNQHIIKANRKVSPGEEQPCLTIKSVDGNIYGFEAVIMKDNEEVARVVYRPHKPLKCGAHCWIETYNEVVVETERFEGES